MTEYERLTDIALRARVMLRTTDDAPTRAALTQYAEDCEAAALLIGSDVSPCEVYSDLAGVHAAHGRGQIVGAWQRIDPGSCIKANRMPVH
jgi:hypothetical protein